MDRKQGCWIGWLQKGARKQKKNICIHTHTNLKPIRITSKLEEKREWFGAEETNLLMLLMYILRNTRKISWCERRSANRFDQEAQF